MNQIKSLADELRETIKKDDGAKKGNPSKTTLVKKNNHSRQERKPADASLESLFENILAFDLTGKEKLLIRLDDRTIFLLKQLKIAKAIDMNKLIAYSLKDFLDRHTELIQYIKENIKTIEL
ncbi:MULTISPECIES: hypothetical protein [Olivibacter]|uniref:Uncharacterized protein n=1 Tax=Olivibacter jilunii TaxID=985016 RepID=A0ABW6B6X1_9SPHI